MTSSDEFRSEHGLSLYIETENHKLLFDTGASDLFAENAKKMGIDLSAVDLVVISHGHYDHGGGLKTLLDINSTAKIYFHEKAFTNHYSNRSGNKVYIGLNGSLFPNDRFVLCGERLVIDEEIELFSDVRQKRLVPSGNVELFKSCEGIFVQDDFAHEQNLIISQGEKTLLIAGCAHNGIVNILDRFHFIKGRMPDYVIGGFHLYSHSAKRSEKPETVDEIGRILLKTQSHFYTCHCTGIESYHRLKSIMGENISYVSTGDQLTIQMQGA